MYLSLVSLDNFLLNNFKKAFIDLNKGFSFVKLIVGALFETKWVKERRYMITINLYGEPSAGKTATMFGLTSYLKKLEFGADIGSEYYKELVYQSTPPGEEDNLAEITRRTHDMVEKLGGQISIFANQRARLKRLEGTVDFAITDCPLPLIGYYSKGDSNPFLFDTIKHAHSEFQSIGFLIKRTHKFEKRARVHNEEAAQKVADELPAFLKDFCPNEKIIVVNSGDNIEDVIFAHLIKEKVLDFKLPKSTLQKVEKNSGLKLF